MDGRIVTSGGPELADELEESGYEGIAADLGIDELTVAVRPRHPIRSVIPRSVRTRSPTRSPETCTEFPQHGTTAVSIASGIDR